MTIAQILGGPHDGLSIEYLGPHICWKGFEYVALSTDEGRVFYLLASMRDEWYSVGR